MWFCPIPLVMFAAAVTSVALGGAVVARRRGVLLWVVPATAVVAGWVGYALWFGLGFLTH